jgi:transposase
MMGRLSYDQEQLFYSFRLDEAVPNDHPVREVAAVLDLSWVHSELAPYYPRLGGPSESDLAYRWFCGLSIEDKIPDHSAFSRARTCGGPMSAHSAAALAAPPDSAMKSRRR